MQQATVFSLLICSLLMISCGQQEGTGSADGRLPVMVSILPQAEFVERIGGARVQVGVLVGPGQSPATYDPSPKQMTELADARLFFSIGVPFEQAILPRIRETLPNLTIVDTSEGITLRAMTAHHHHDHAHAGHDEHEGDDEQDGHDGHAHDGKDPHIWLAPALVQQQARTIAAALIAADPDHRGFYEGNLAAYLADLEALDEHLREALAPLRGKTLLVYHPAWGYLAEAYGMHQEAIEIEGKEPSARQLAAIIDEAKAEDVQVIFVQRQFSRSSAEAVAEAIGGSVVAIDPLAREHLANLEHIATEIRRALHP